MDNQKFNSIDDYYQFADETFGHWSSGQRVLFSAAMAERWLAVYDEFSRREQWGDPTALRHALDVVWECLGRSTLAPAEANRLTAQIHDCTPHMDDFDDIAALAAAVMVSEAVRSCIVSDNMALTVQSALSGFEAVAPEWELDPEDQPRLWRQVAVRKELKKQLKLIEEISVFGRFETKSIAKFRHKLQSKEYRGEVTPEPAQEQTASGITNQLAFEQYRRMVEADIKGQNNDWWQREYSPSSTMWTMMVFAAWMGRYSRRRRTIDGEYGKLSDIIGRQALVSWLRTRDAAQTTPPDWDAEARNMMELSLANPHHGLGITSINQAHGHGPSLRSLWLEARSRGKSQIETWNHILQWGSHRPRAWAAEDERKKRGLAHTSAALGEYLQREIEWETTDDPALPWAAQVEACRWQVRVNDFPDDYMYSLLIGGEPAGSFHDWPANWRRV